MGCPRSPAARHGLPTDRSCRSLFLVPIALAIEIFVEGYENRQPSMDNPTALAVSLSPLSFVIVCAAKKGPWTSICRNRDCLGRIYGCLRPSQQTHRRTDTAAPVSMRRTSWPGLCASSSPSRRGIGWQVPWGDLFCRLIGSFCGQAPAAMFWNVLIAFFSPFGNISISNVHESNGGDSACSIALRSFPTILNK